MSEDGKRTFSFIAYIGFEYVFYPVLISFNYLSISLDNKKTTKTNYRPFAKH